jgi:hypothetical protein
MVTTKLLFSAIEAAKLLTFPKLKCFGNRLPSRVIRLRRCSIPLGRLSGSQFFL